MSDAGRMIASPIAGVANRGRDYLFDELAKVVREREVVVVVVGLPINMDDSFGPKAVEAQEVAEALHARLALPVEMFDERLSTVQAQWVAQEVGLTKKKTRRRLDSIAAQTFLQTWLNLQHRRD